MIDRQQLLKDLQRLLPKIEQDILTYTESKPDLNDHLKQEYAKAKEANRTAEHFVAWREAQITQAAVAWLLTCVFVRFLEDNQLLDEPVISGPAGTGLQHAKGKLTVYFNEHPTHAEREYLLHLFESLEQFPVMAELLDHRHNPLWQLPVSADGAKSIIDFFQQLDPETGDIVHDFTDPDWDTRFLGDLYQDLSESVRKRYALLQTPEFVESFILDYTLEKAKDTFGLEGLRLIDPTCGSGHFLLTSFERLFNDWIKREPTTNARALAQRALDSVYGVDINPYAVAVARFRLLISAMKAADSDKIRLAPDFHFNLAVGDSLLHGKRHESQGQGIQTDSLDDPIAHVLEVEDREKLEKYLGQRYHAVVGNPPYITVKDKALNQAYRDKYLTCHRKYSLGVPFTERFFDLALAAQDNHQAGYVGMITTNSFMKREFGKKLIEEYLPKKELTHIIDTSGAYIPGHGTPTVILFARNQLPQNEQIRAVLGIRGEPAIPKKASDGKVWLSILELFEKDNAENNFISVVIQERKLYERHPWSLTGGGTSELKELIESRSVSALVDRVSEIGFGAITGEDELYAGPRIYFDRLKVPMHLRKVFVEGDAVRDWGVFSEQQIFFPYGDDLEAIDKHNQCVKDLWPFRCVLSARLYFGKTHFERGMEWFEYAYISKAKNAAPFLISFAFVATHNHFVLDRGERVFKQSAPVIKLPDGATEADHYSLLGALNSSISCFWGRQVFFSKRGEDVGRWGEFLEFDGTKLKRFPLVEDPANKSRDIARKIDVLSQKLVHLDPASVLENCTEPDQLSMELESANHETDSLYRQMISLQEELDWVNYQLYGLIDEDLNFHEELPEVNLGERTFEIRLARDIQAGEAENTWFTRHRSQPVIDVPSLWPVGYREIVERRLKVIEENRWIRLVEQPEYKRRWNIEPWDKKQQRALREFLLDHLEQVCHTSELQTCAQLADRTRNDRIFQEAAALYAGSATFDESLLVADLVNVNHVPQMAAARYKPKALSKFRAWQETWNLQRAEDAIDIRTELEESDTRYLNSAQANALKDREIGDIPVPPKYTSSDFLKPSYKSLRGRLDMPRERFFSMPYCERAGDSTLVIGWAGLNHLQRAQAIAAWYLDRKEQEGWYAEKLKPMLVALDELIPWLKQWHNVIDPEYGERMGDYYDGFLLEELRHFGLSRDELTAWEPPKATRGGGRRRNTIRAE